ncbi:MAG: efflux RND transporter periplasmic adaptor subunit [Gammaproteobacteria bacterium]
MKVVLIFSLFLSLSLVAEKSVNLHEVKIINEYSVNKLLPGKITPKRQSILGFEVSGKIKKVHVDIGDKVIKGDLIAELEDSEALALYNEAKAKLSMFKKVFDRSKSLNADNFVSDQELERAESNFLVSQAQYDRSLIKFKQTKILAPYDGIIQNRFLDEGSIINASIPIVEILDSEHVEAKVSLPKSLIGIVNIGQTYKFLIDDEEFEAKLTRLAPMSERGSNNKLGLFEFNNFFNPGATARLMLNTKESRKGAWIPLNSLSQAEQGLWNVFTITDENEAKKDYVELIHIENNMAYVSGTLKTGDLVIIGGSAKVAEGQSLKAN